MSDEQEGEGDDADDAGDDIRIALNIYIYLILNIWIYLIHGNKGQLFHAALHGCMKMNVISLALKATHELHSTRSGR